jgi:hypothetical protein
MFTMHARNTTASLERLIRRDFPEWLDEASKIAAAKNRDEARGPKDLPWTTADVLFLALRLGLDELTNRYREDNK